MTPTSALHYVNAPHYVTHFPNNQTQAALVELIQEQIIVSQPGLSLKEILTNLGVYEKVLKHRKQGAQALGRKIGVAIKRGELPQITRRVKSDRPKSEYLYFESEILFDFIREWVSSLS